MNSIPPHPGSLAGDTALREQAEEQMIERLVDEIGAQSFPASDPPAWGVIAARVKAARHIHPTGESR
jgi:hypothetical protein